MANNDPGSNSSGNGSVSSGKSGKSKGKAKRKGSNSGNGKKRGRNSGSNNTSDFSGRSDQGNSQAAPIVTDGNQVTYTSPLSAANYTDGLILSGTGTLLTSATNTSSGGTLTMFPNYGGFYGGIYVGGASVTTSWGGSSGNNTQAVLTVARGGSMTMSGSSMVSTPSYTLAPGLVFVGMNGTIANYQYLPPSQNLVSLGVIPEPTTWGLMILGACFVTFCYSKKRHAAGLLERG